MHGDIIWAMKKVVWFCEIWNYYIQVRQVLQTIFSWSCPQIHQSLKSQSVIDVSICYIGTKVSWGHCQTNCFGDKGLIFWYFYRDYYTKIQQMMGKVMNLFHEKGPTHLNSDREWWFVSLVNCNSHKPNCNCWNQGLSAYHYREKKQRFILMYYLVIRWHTPSKHLFWLHF